MKIKVFNFLTHLNSSKITPRSFLKYELCNARAILRLNIFLSNSLDEIKLFQNFELI